MELTKIQKNIRPLSTGKRVFMPEEYIEVIGEPYLVRARDVERVPKKAKPGGGWFGPIWRG